jgi:membrane protein
MIFFLGAEFARQYALQMGSLKDQDVPGAPKPSARPSPVH